MVGVAEIKLRLIGSDRLTAATMRARRAVLIVVLVLVVTSLLFLSVYLLKVKDSSIENNQHYHYTGVSCSFTLLTTDVL